MLQTITPETSYTLDESADLLGLQKSYIYKLITQGVFTTIRDDKDKRVRRIPYDQLVRFKPDVRYKVEALATAPETTEEYTAQTSEDVEKVLSMFAQELDIIQTNMSILDKKDTQIEPLLSKILAVHKR